jgi:hypothetical protein
MASASVKVHGIHSSEGVRKIAACNRHHPDKLLESVLKDYNLMVDVKVSTANLTATLRDYPYVKPSDLIKVLASKGHLSKCLGVPVETSPEIFREFWRRFCLIHPNHEVFQRISTGEIDPSYLVPIYGHADGGTGYRKSSVDIFQWQPALGSGTRASIKQVKKGHLKTQMLLNYTGHSFRTRWLFGLVRSVTYKSDPGSFQAFLKLWADELKSIYQDGVQVGVNKYWFVTLGAKADIPFATKISNSSRTHSSIRKVAPGPNPNWLKGCCIWCCGGKGPISFENFNLQADWVATIGKEMPWAGGVEPQLITQLPHDTDNPAEFFLRDVFHITKSGHGKNFGASGIVYSLHLFGKRSLPAALDELNTKFRASKVHCHFGTFSKDMLGLGSAGDYPVGHWSAGSDTPKVMGFLKDWLETEPEAVSKDPMLEDIILGCKALEHCLKVMYESGWWFNREEAGP